MTRHKISYRRLETCEFDDTTKRGGAGDKNSRKTRPGNFLRGIGHNEFGEGFWAAETFAADSELTPVQPVESMGEL